MNYSILNHGYAAESQILNFLSEGGTPTSDDIQKTLVTIALDGGYSMLLNELLTSPGSRTTTLDNGNLKHLLNFMAVLVIDGMNVDIYRDFILLHSDVFGLGATSITMISNINTFTDVGSSSQFLLFFSRIVEQNHDSAVEMFEQARRFNNMEIVKVFIKYFDSVPGIELVYPQRASAMNMSSSSTPRVSYPLSSEMLRFYVENTDFSLPQHREASENMLEWYIQNGYINDENIEVLLGNPTKIEYTKDDFFLLLDKIEEYDYGYLFPDFAIDERYKAFNFNIEEDVDRGLSWEGIFLHVRDDEYEDSELLVNEHQKLLFSNASFSRMKEQDCIYNTLPEIEDDDYQAYGALLFRAIALGLELLVDRILEKIDRLGITDEVEYVLNSGEDYNQVIYAFMTCAESVEILQRFVEEGRMNFDEIVGKILADIEAYDITDPQVILNFIDFVAPRIEESNSLQPSELIDFVVNIVVSSEGTEKLLSLTLSNGDPFFDPRDKETYSNEDFYDRYDKDEFDEVYAVILNFLGEDIGVEEVVTCIRRGYHDSLLFILTAGKSFSIEEYTRFLNSVFGSETGTGYKTMKILLQNLQNLSIRSSVFDLFSRDMESIIFSTTARNILSLVFNEVIRLGLDEVVQRFVDLNNSLSIDISSIEATSSPQVIQILQNSQYDELVEEALDPQEDERSLLFSNWRS